MDRVKDNDQGDLRYCLMMKDYETKLHENSEDLFIELCQNMIANRFEIASNYFKKQSKEYKPHSADLTNFKLQLQKKLQDNDNVSILKKARIDEHNAQIISKQTIENMNRMLEEQNKATARFASVTDSHTKICICYNEITNLLHTEPCAKQVCDKFISSLKCILSNINKIMDLCKSGALTEKEVKQAEVLALNMENIHKNIHELLNEIKRQELIEKQKKEEEARMKEMEEKKIQESKVAEIKIEKYVEKARIQPIFYSSSNYSYYLELKNFLDDYESRYKDLLENVNLKKFRFDCQKAVNIPVNAMSSVSGTHMRDKYDKLSKLLKGEKVQVLDTFVQATQHPQGLCYCTALLAKKIVRQGDLLVSSNPEAAFPLAAVTVALWAQFPEFGKLLEANFHKQCPYLVPMFLPQKEGQTDKDFYLSRGYIYNDEGVVEKQDKFLKRMSGIFRLHCAVWIAKTPRFLNTSNPCSLKYAWQWLASFINLKPEPDISATLINDFLTICGSEVFKYYGQQFTKIIKLISTEYITILENIDEGGPKTRLEVFLQNVLKSGHLPPPNGLLPANTW